MKKRLFSTLFMTGAMCAAMAQTNGLVDMQQSQYAKMSNMPLGAT